MILNFVFDFLLLLSVSIILRRNISINRLIIGAFIGGINILFFYMASIVLGGFLYCLNIQFSYKNNGLVFFHHGLSINFIFLIIFSPIIIYIYIKQCKELKNNYASYYKANLYLDNNCILRLNDF